MSTNPISKRRQLGEAIAFIVEAMPNLRSMTIEVDDDGEVSIAYKTREVRVVEESGSLKVRSR